MKYEFGGLLLICFIMQVYGCFLLIKNISKLKGTSNLKGFNKTFHVFLTGLIMQVFLITILSFTYIFITPKLEKDLKSLQELSERYSRESNKLQLPEPLDHEGH